MKLQRSPGRPGTRRSALAGAGTGPVPRMHTGTPGSAALLGRGSESGMGNALRFNQMYFFFFLPLKWERDHCVPLL